MHTETALAETLDGSDVSSFALVQAVQGFRQ